MGDSLFDIFGDHHKTQSLKNVARQPISNIGNENMGKIVSLGPLKQNEPIKPLKKASEPKKTFLSNTGKALQNTPLRSAFTPRVVNVGTLIYNDDNDKKNCEEINYEEIEFTKPTYKLDNYYDLIDIIEGPQPHLQVTSPPPTPPPNTQPFTMELNTSYIDDFFTDDFSNEAFPDDDDLDLPDIY